jgi:hypothetical protein
MGIYTLRGNPMLDSNKVLLKLIERYDYGGAYTLLVDMDLDNTDVAYVVKSCRYAINFDFESAKETLEFCSETTQNMAEYKELYLNLKALNYGEPKDVFSELMENLKIKLINEEYIDFLGRVYRFKEAVFKYMFVKKHIERSKFSMNVVMMSKRYQLKVLRKKYKIFNSNLEFALTTYFNKYQRDEYRYIEIARLLNSDRINALIELRNDSIVGHGFTGVSRNDIAKVYANPYNVLDDFRLCLEKLDLEVSRYKYSHLNELIIKLSARIRQEKNYVEGIHFE